MRKLLTISSGCGLSIPSAKFELEPFATGRRTAVGPLTSDISAAGVEASTGGNRFGTAAEFEILDSGLLASGRRAAGGSLAWDVIAGGAEAPAEGDRFGSAAGLAEIEAERAATWRRADGRSLDGDIAGAARGGDGFETAAEFGGSVGG